METASLTQFRCQYCQREFLREGSLAVHVCETKRRYQERDDMAVQLGLQAYLRFYEITQGQGRSRTWDDFVRSPYYRAFVRFGQHCREIRAVNVRAFTDWVIKQNKKIDHWCHDSIYTEYLLRHVQTEAAGDAIARALETALQWEHDTQYPCHNYLRHAGTNRVCHAVTSGRVTGWTLYNCRSGQEFLTSLNSEQIAMIWSWIDSDFWHQRLRDHPEDTAFARDMLSRAGW